MNSTGGSGAAEAPQQWSGGAAGGPGGPPAGAAANNIFTIVTDDPKYKWKVLTSVIFGLFMVILDSTVVNVALKQLQTQFSVTTNEAQWVISLYTLALGIATPLSGFLGEKFGIKRIFLAGLTVFVLGSVLCGLATNADSLFYLIAARGLQGLGGGVALPLGTAMLFGAFPPRERGVAFGIFGIALVFAPASGPLLGGWLVDSNLLPWIFFVNVPIGIVGVSLGLRFLRESKSQRPLKADPLGIILSTIGFGSILYAASIAGQEGMGWTAPETLTFFAIGALALIAFAVNELRVGEPLLDLRLFNIRTFTLANIVGWVGIVGLFGAEFLLPLYLQILRGKSAFDTGLFLLPLALVSGLVTPIAGKLADKFGPRLPLVLGFALISFNTWQFRDIQLDTDLGWITFLLIIRGIGFGLVIQNTLVGALADVPLRLTARATALSNATRQTVQAIGVALLATVLTSAITINIGAEMQKSLPDLSNLPPAAQQAAQAAMQQFQQGQIPDMTLLPEQMRPVIAEVVHRWQEQYIVGFDHAYTLTFIVAVLATLLSMLLPGWPAPYTSRTEAAESIEGRGSAGAPTH